ncbi:MAG: AbrB/MazE/SpoVT family DNA-binding domain-containing protein [Candidatus Woykebacteria bacterium]
MPQTKISDKYQVVIPKEIRKKVGLKEGQSLNVYAAGDKIVLSPQKIWPDGYIGSQEDIWKDVDVAKYLAAERDSWQ